MGKFFKVFVVFGLLMGLLGLGLMFLDSDSANDTAHEPESAHKTAAQVEADAYKDQIAKFRREFPTLKKTIPNLRWFDDQILSGQGAEALENVDLVTPFGPCISMISGHGLYSLDFTEDQFDMKQPSKLIGTYANRADAVRVAETYCGQWYMSESNNSASPARSRPLWFTPDPEVAPLPAPTRDSPGNSTEPGEQDAPIERTNPSQTPAPSERTPPDPN